MSILSLIQLALNILDTVLKATSTASLPTEVIAEINGAVESLKKVMGTQVTFAQLESLRAKDQW